jgi:hypothetical protein
MARQDLQALHIDSRLVVAVLRMEVWTPDMVRLVVVHPDHDPEERADSWHQKS